MSLYVGVNDVARKLTNGYVGVNGTARKIVKGYVGVNGVAQPIYSADSIPSFATATDAEITALLEAHRNGEIDLTRYWHVGDKRTIHLSAMNGLDENESHIGQDQVFVILHGPGRYLLSDSTYNIFVIGMEGVLNDGTYAENGYIHSVNTVYLVKFSTTNRGAWFFTDDVFRNALPAEVRKWFKSFGIPENGFNSVVSTNGYFTLPSLAEVTDLNSYSDGQYYYQIPKEGSILDYYAISGNWKKTIPGSNDHVPYFTRSHISMSEASDGPIHYITICDDGYGNRVLTPVHMNVNKAITVFGCV